MDWQGAANAVVGRPVNQLVASLSFSFALPFASPPTLAGPRMVAAQVVRVDERPWKSMTVGRQGSSSRIWKVNNSRGA